MFQQNNHWTKLFIVGFTAVQHERGPRKRKSSTAETSEEEESPVKCKKEKPSPAKSSQSSELYKPITITSSTGSSAIPTSALTYSLAAAPAGISFPYTHSVAQPPAVNPTSYMSVNLQKQAFQAGFIHR